MGEYPKSEIRDGMRIDWDVPLEMDDGIVLRCDVFRPIQDGEYPVILSYGPYGKWLHFPQLYEKQWAEMTEECPEIAVGSTNKYMAWETVDPEKWVPDGYAVVRVDSRGAGRSPGYLNPHSQREREDFAQCIEWAGRQPWSNGKVGLNGISYYAVSQWQVANLQPDHLEAICVWEGVSDRYRDGIHHGGITCTYRKGWYERQVKSIQHGASENGYRSHMTGDWVAGPETLTTEELGANRTDFPEDQMSHKLRTDEYWNPRMGDLSKIEVPLLSAGNWGGHGLHLRGNVEGFLRAGSEQKWLEIHTGTHWTPFYSDFGLNLQKRFFGHFLKGEDTGWDDQPRVQFDVRHPAEEFHVRYEDNWPIPRTDWTRYYLHPEGIQLSTQEQTETGSITYQGFGDGVTFLTNPFKEETEITGPIASKLFVSSDTEDADLFLVVRLFKPDMEEVVFQGAADPHKPIALGWLRASHRKLDEGESEEWRPYHTHDEVQPLEPGEIYELDIEVWPTCVVAPEGYRLGLTVRGKDYRYPGVDPENTWRGMTGVGSQRHDDARDRPPEVYNNKVTIHTGPEYPSHLLLPIVPDQE